MLQSNMKQQEQKREQQKKIDRLPTQESKKILEVIPTQTKEMLEREHEKLLRMPRSKKFSKMMKEIDVPSMLDEELMARMKEANGYAPEDDVTFTPEDMESFRERVQAEVAEIVAKELEKQKEKEEKLVEKYNVDKEAEADAEFVRELLVPPLEEIVSSCCISGCRIHAITSSGQIKEHYQVASMGRFPMAYRMADKLISDSGGYVEIYGKKLVHRTSAGDTIKIVYVDEEE